MSDLPPLAVPPMPNGASRIELYTGWYIAPAGRLEIEMGVVGAGYLVRFAENTPVKRGVLSTRLAATWFTQDGAEMPLDRYWTGPFVRGEVGTDLLGRHDAWAFGRVNRGAFDLGLRYPLGPTSPTTGALSVGYAVAKDTDGVTYSGMKHGVRLQLDFALR